MKAAVAVLLFCSVAFAQDKTVFGIVTETDSTITVTFTLAKEDAPTGRPKHLLVTWTQPDTLADHWRGWVRRLENNKTVPEYPWESVGAFMDDDWIDKPALLDSALYKFTMVAVGMTGKESTPAPHFKFRGDGVKAFRFLRNE